MSCSFTCFDSFSRRGRSVFPSTPHLHSLPRTRKEGDACGLQRGRKRAHTQAGTQSSRLHFPYPKDVEVEEVYLLLLMSTHYSSSSSSAHTHAYLQYTPTHPSPPSSPFTNKENGVSLYVCSASVCFRVTINFFRTTNFGGRPLSYGLLFWVVMFLDFLPSTPSLLLLLLLQCVSALHLKPPSFSDYYCRCCCCYCCSFSYFFISRLHCYAAVVTLPEFK